MSLFSCLLYHLRKSWSKQYPSNVYSVFVSSSLGWNKGNMMLSLSCMICVGLFSTVSALRARTVVSTSWVSPQVSSMCLCARWVFNKCSWLIYWLFTIARKQCHILFQRSYRVLRQSASGVLWGLEVSIWDILKWKSMRFWKIFKLFPCFEKYLYNVFTVCNMVISLFLSKEVFLVEGVLIWYALFVF